MSSALLEERPEAFEEKTSVLRGTGIAACAGTKVILLKIVSYKLASALRRRVG